MTQTIAAMAPEKASWREDRSASKNPPLRNTCDALPTANPIPSFLCHQQSVTDASPASRQTPTMRTSQNGMAIKLVPTAAKHG